MKKEVFFIWIFLCLAFCQSGLAQQAPDSNDALHRLLKNLETFQKDYPAEQIYLHTDRSYYQTGEDLWFKAYVTVSQFNFLSAISKIMYVELLNDQQEIIQSRRLPVVSGLSLGDFHLPDHLEEGTYTIRAYTNWMRNFDESSFFNKKIHIGSSTSGGLHTSYQFTYLHDSDTLKGTIRLTDLQGKPVRNKPVEYRIDLGKKNQFQEHTSFDSAGILTFHILNKGGNKGVLGRLTLNIDQGSNLSVKTIPIQLTSTNAHIQFFPEGGLFTNGIPTKVGFRAYDREGAPLSAQGQIEVEGQVVATFKGNQYGSGFFQLIPEAGKTYVAVTTFPDGEISRVPLPDPQPQGYGFSVDNSDPQQIQATLIASEQEVRQQQIALIAQQNGLVYYAVKGKLTSNHASFSVPKKDLPSGIVQLALLNENMDLIATRDIFLMQADTLSLDLEIPQKTYGRRAPVDLSLRMPTAQDSTSIGSFSLSVINLDKAPPSRDNILSALLLQANQQGTFLPVELEQLDQEALRDIDQLLLCRPINKLFWANMKAGKFPEKAYSPEKELKISGMVTSPDGTPLNKAQVTLASFQHTTIVLDTLTGPDGRFSFDKILFYNQPDFIVQARDAKGRKNVKVILDEVPNQEIAEQKNASSVKVHSNKTAEASSSNKNSLDEVQQVGFDEKSIVLEEVEVSAKKENPAKHSSNLNGAGKADQVISGDELYNRGCPTIDICLQGRLTGVIFQGGIPYSTRSMNRPMQVVLDGMYMPASSLNTINPFDVASIEVLRTPENTAIYGMYGGGGLLIITTRRGDQPPGGSYELQTPGITTFSPQGFYEIRRFAAPDYGQSTSQGGNPDRRNTIYWQPDWIIPSDEAGQARFFTADEPGTYRIEIEGLDVNGHLGRLVRYIQVK